MSRKTLRDRDRQYGPRAIGLRCARCGAAPGEPCMTVDRVTGQRSRYAADLLHAVRLLAAQQLAGREGKAE